MSDASKSSATWREQLVQAHEAVAAAEEERRRVFQGANKAGVSFRAIAQATGLSAATAYRYAGCSADEKRGFAMLDVLAPPPYKNV